VRIRNRISAPGVTSAIGISGFTCRAAKSGRVTQIQP
jgi:hypothetical protein